MPPRTPLPVLGLVLLPLLTIGWGLHWPIIKIVVLEVPIWQYRALTAFAAALVLLGLARLNATRSNHVRLMPRRDQWLPLVIAAIFNITLWQILSAYGALLLPSGRSAILAYTMPLWATLLSIFVLDERMTARIGLALVFGLAGVGVLVSADLTALVERPEGTLAILGAALAWAIGVVLTKRVAWDISVVALTGWQLLIGSLPIAVIAFAAGPIVIHQAPIHALLGMLYTTFIGLCFCYYAWFKIISLFPASTAAIAIFMTPAVGLMSGSVILGEPIGWREITALALVCGALVLALRRPAPIQSRTERP